MVTDEQGNRFYSAEEAGQLLGMSRSTFLKKVKEADIKKWGMVGDKRVYYRVEDIEALKNRPPQMYPLDEKQEGRAAPALAY